ncbi:MobA/MobL family protein [Phaeobacter sp. 22II1-1F12B]|uniref:MobA/MobL family protein n=1 Tax=Phaeobacter sp. 22II1-1F12B TaxID=1317111 RepID=UPI000B5274B9|nr:MobA/MobL family protein [Phaeobacter sp. 22II1-1F12B]
MALFSFRHSVKTFSDKRTCTVRAAKFGQTLSHLRYITRPKAARTVIQGRLDGASHKEIAEATELRAEKGKGRVCERFTIALPVEANEVERAALVSAYAEHLTGGVASYVAAIHDIQGNDVRNPHFHLVCFDKYQRKGGRGRPRSVMGMARKNAIQSAAKDWATIHNRMMLQWGYGKDSQIDHRSYEERGIDKIPTIHEGAGARAIGKRSIKAEKKPDWQKIDSGFSRAEANRCIREINSLKESLNDHGNNRLGGGDKGNTVGSKGGVPWQRESCRSDSGNEPRADVGGAIPVKVSSRNQSRTSPFDFHRDRTAPTQRSSPKHNEPPFINRKKNRPQGQSNLIRSVPFRGHRVRRVFHELVLTRDTLKTRLLRIGAQSPVLRVAEDLMNASEMQATSRRTREDPFK